MSSRRQACGLCAVALVLIGLSGVAHATRVAMYMSEAKDVLDMKWDQGPSNLGAQLIQAGLTVKPSLTGQPDLTNADAYVIPVQNGQVYYSEAEDMQAVASYVASGGLVVMLDANAGHGEALKSFVSKALNLNGDWDVCKQFVTNARTSLGEPALAERAASFLGGEWPAFLEDAQITTVQTLCRHQDPAAVSTPLYTVLGDDMKTVAQAFTKTGNPGAVVWLGYSWKDGPQESWGKVLAKVVTEYSAGRVEVVNPATQQHSMTAHLESDISTIIEAVADASVDAAAISRRFLQTPAYYFPPPTPAPVIPINPIVFSPQVVNPVPPSPGTSPAPQPQQQTVPFANVLAQGTDVNGTLVYKFSANFNQLREKRSPLNLLRMPKFPCVPPNGSALNTCYNCPRSYQAHNGIRNPPFITLALYFYNAVQLSQIKITQIRAPGLIKAELLVFQGVGQASANLGPVIFNQTSDVSACQATTTIDIKPDVSHINDPVPDNTDAALRASAFQGVALTFSKPPQRINATIVTEVRFSGRALYASPSLFARRRKQ